MTIIRRQGSTSFQLIEELDRESSAPAQLSSVVLLVIKNLKSPLSPPVFEGFFIGHEEVHAYPAFLMEG